MTVLLQLGLFVGVVVAIVLVLVVVQRLLRSAPVERPREDPALQQHLAVARSQLCGTGFGP